MAAISFCYEAKPLTRAVHGTRLSGTFGVQIGFPADLSWPWAAPTGEFQRSRYPQSEQLRYRLSITSLFYRKTPGKFPGLLRWEPSLFIYSPLIPVTLKS